MADTLAILRSLNADHYTSGAALAERFACSRASISGALAQSETYGIRLERKHGVGYKLIHPIEWLDEARIASQLAADTQLCIRCCSETESTNRQLLVQAQHGQALAAEWQTGGRGRRGRRWQGQAGASLLFSLAWQFDGGPDRLAGLPLAVGLTVAETLAQAGVARIALKWPNDLLLPASEDWGKAGGILIEMQGDALGPSLLVIGIGLNLAPPGQDTGQVAAGLQEHGLRCGRNELLGQLLANLETMLRTFSRQGFTSALQAGWERRHAWQNQPVTAYLPDGSTQHGIACGISSDGSLRLRTTEGEILLGSGDISLRRG
ncbi:biotin--[acetyl-CoA-carboxylase] ligase [Chitinilyticum aquatile]|uniref:biotin--[acetyl-CoA-carboxylase] ligase n=1 Tax=Chitinilyticum aquatile TaxID=362520 RepID=UPI0003FD53B3|nr:biotin--[acetyl-CoA-carboxylase] ligase [Chitinilyticum aquatile]